jgi:hypothetical protein
MGKRMIRGALLVLVAGAMVIPATAANASEGRGGGGGGGGVVDRGSCSAGSKFKLSASREDGGIEVQFEIEGRAGETFRVRLLDNGDRFFRGRRTTNAAGELRVRRVTDNLAGPDHIVARATDVQTGETCVGSVTI